MRVIRNIFLMLLASMFIGGGVSFAQSFSYKDEGIRIGEKEFKDVKGYRLGAAEIKMGLADEVQYDSNIFLKSSDEKGDVLNITTPSILANVPLGMEQRHLLQLYYDADAVAFSNYTNQNYVNQHSLVNANFRLPFGFFNAQNDFVDTVERAGTELTDQVRRYEDRYKTTLGIIGNKLSYETSYSRFNKHYVKDDYSTFDHYIDAYNLTAFYQLYPKTKALLEVEHGVIDYTKDSTRNGYYNQVMTGLRGDISGKTVGLAKAGYQSREYRVDGQNGYEGFVSEVSLNTKFSERREMNLRFNSSAVESVYSDNNYYNTNAVTWDIRQDIIGNFSLLFSAGYTRNVYPNISALIDDHRKDKIATGGTALQYKLKHFGKLKLGYEYSEDNSNIDESDYIRHLVYTKVDLRF